MTTLPIKMALVIDSDLALLASSCQLFELKTVVFPPFKFSCQIKNERNGNGQEGEGRAFRFAKISSSSFLHLTDIKSSIQLLSTQVNGDTESQASQTG